MAMRTSVADAKEVLMSSKFITDIYGEWWIGQEKKVYTNATHS